jgi:hypothetical protein
MMGFVVLSLAVVVWALWDACILRQHRWRHIKGGIYQCDHCKSLSAGKDRDDEYTA